ncbi:MAG: histidine kinase [Dehalococcoidia bacterium]
MVQQRFRFIPTLLVALSVLIELVAVPLSWGLEPLWDTLLLAVSSIAGTAAGALILYRHPRHAIGWLLVAQGVLAAFTGDLAQGWGLRAAERGWGFGPAAEFIGTANWLPSAPLVVAVLVLYPNGHLISRRWSLVLWLSIAGVLLAEPGWVFNPEAGSEYVSGHNPYAIAWLPTGVMFVAGFVIVATSLLAAAVAVVVRFRAAEEVERLQLKWFTLASGILAVGITVGGALWFVTPIAHVLPTLVVTMWPVVICTAILRFRLYDVDLVISRTLTYATVTVLLVAAYAAAGVVLGVVIGRDSAWVTAGATMLAAALFGPMRRRVQSRVDRRFRRQRHDALAILETFVDELRQDHAEPEQVVDAIRAAMRDDQLDVLFVLQREGPGVDAHGRPVSDVDPRSDRVPVRRGGITLAEVVWTPSSDANRALLSPVLDAASIAIEMARLRVELRQRLNEINESRSRIAAVADDERRRLARDLHDGAQQRLVSIGLALRHAQHELTHQPESARRTLDGAVVEIGTAIEELRALAHGLRPALLQDGLGPALRDLASRSPVPVAVKATSDRYPTDVETAAYFVACEGLTNAVKHAGATSVRLEVARRDSTLIVSIADDGAGGAIADHGSGLTGLSDRVVALGGRLLIDSGVGCGTTLRAELPCVS